MIHNEVSIVSSKNREKLRTVITEVTPLGLGNTVGQKKKKTTEKQICQFSYLPQAEFAESFYFLLRSTHFI